MRHTPHFAHGLLACTAFAIAGFVASCKGGEGLGEGTLLVPPPTAIPVLEYVGYDSPTQGAFNYESLQPLLYYSFDKVFVVGTPGEIPALPTVAGAR